jgi:hypothetical protein
MPANEPTDPARVPPAWPAWLRWSERAIMIQAFCSIIPNHVLGWSHPAYRYWMYVSLILVVAVTIRRIISVERMRPGRNAPHPFDDIDPTGLG